MAPLQPVSLTAGSLSRFKTSQRQQKQVLPAGMPLVAPPMQFGLKGKDPNAISLLVPNETPFFFLHGTSNTGGIMRRTARWLNERVETNHLTYNSYLPEVQDALGIEKPARKGIEPSYLLTLREIGAFRYQTVANRVSALNKLASGKRKDASLNERLSDQDLMRFFNLRGDLGPLERHRLLEIIRRYVIRPIERVPEGWNPGYRESLSALAFTRVGRLNQRFSELRFRTEESGLIRDSEFLRRAANILKNKNKHKPVTRTGHPENLPGALTEPGEGQDVFRGNEGKAKKNLPISLSLVSPEEVARLESYLRCMRIDLAEAIRNTPVLLRGCGVKTAEERERTVQSIAQKLMDTIAPRIVTAGFSQGGTTIMASLLNYLSHAPALTEDFKKQDPAKTRVKVQDREVGLELLAGQAIGMAVMLSAPLHGISGDPPWGQKVGEAIGRKLHLPPSMLRPMQKLMYEAVWQLRGWRRNGIWEMREGSDLTRRIIASVTGRRGTPSLLARSGVSVISAYDRDDLYIGPQASQLRDARGQAPNNVQHAEIITGNWPAGQKADTLIQCVLGDTVFKTAAIKLLPDSVKGYIEDFYRREIPSVDNHEGIVKDPASAATQMGAHLRRQRGRVLDTLNFEPYRYQSLLLREKYLDQLCLNTAGKPLEERARDLRNYLRTEKTTEGNPDNVRGDFLKLLIENARENLPFKNSASHVAWKLLSKILQLLNQVNADPQLRNEYSDFLKESFEKIRDGDLPRAPGNRSYSHEAARLLAYMETPSPYPTAIA